MKVAYVKIMQDKCQKIIQTKKVEKIKLTDHFVENSALIELYDKRINCEITTTFDFYANKPDLFIKHFCERNNGNMLN